MGAAGRFWPAAPGFQKRRADVVVFRRSSSDLSTGVRESFRLVFVGVLCGVGGVSFVGVLSARWGFHLVSASSFVWSAVGVGFLRIGGGLRRGFVRDLGSCLH